MRWLSDLWFFVRGKPKRATARDALETWNDDFHKWLDILQAVFNDFPDHSQFGDVQLDEKTRKILHEITTLYLEDACNAVSGFALKAERLQRHMATLKFEKQLPPPV